MVLHRIKGGLLGVRGGWRFEKKLKDSKNCLAQESKSLMPVEASPNRLIRNITECCPSDLGIGPLVYSTQRLTRATVSCQTAECDTEPVALGFDHKKVTG